MRETSFLRKPCVLKNNELIVDRLNVCRNNDFLCSGEKLTSTWRKNLIDDSRLSAINALLSINLIFVFFNIYVYLKKCILLHKTGVDQDVISQMDVFLRGDLVQSHSRMDCSIFGDDLESLITLEDSMNSTIDEYNQHDLFNFDDILTDLADEGAQNDSASAEHSGERVHLDTISQSSTENVRIFANIKKKETLIGANKDKVLSAPKEKRKKKKSVPESLKDDNYLNKRQKNNESAKRSRELKRNKEILAAAKVQKLEIENKELKAENRFLRQRITLLNNQLLN